MDKQTLFVHFLIQNTNHLLSGGRGNECERGHKDIVRVLLERGVHVHISALASQCRSGNIELFRLLMPFVDLTTYNNLREALRTNRNCTDAVRKRR